MAQRAQPLGGPAWAGIGAAALLLALVAATLGAVLVAAEAPGWLSAADRAALRFTLLQAGLSALLSTALAIPVARALARRQFPGRAALITLLGAPFLLPVIVAVIGLLAIFGRSGLINAIFAALGLPPINIYGLQGVLLGHVFFNLPLATRFLLQGWLAIPAERFRLAAALDFGPRETFRWLELPMLRATVPGAVLTVFLICLTSFAVALTLGGGPRATTIELAIYQAFRFDFDLGRAALLGAVQILLCMLAAALALRVALPSEMGSGLDRIATRFDIRGRHGLLAADSLWLILATAFLLLPLGAVILAGAPGLFALPSGLWPAAARSVAVALASTALMLALVVPIASAILRAERIGRRGLARGLEIAVLLLLAASPLVLGTGLFLLARPWADPVSLALPVTVAVNAAMALPFGLRAILPALREAEAGFGRLADSLGLRGRARLRLVTLPRLRRPLGFAAGLAAAMSMGDLGVIALFANPEAATLPLQLYRLMAAYRMQDAAGAALLLMVLSLGLFWIFDRGGRGNAAV